MTTTGRARRAAPTARSVVAIAAAAAAVASGCAAPPTSLPTHTATLTVDGAALQDRFDVLCTQTQWLWKIASIRSSPGFTAFVRTDNTVNARAVTLTDLRGFTGSYSDATQGQARGQLANGTFTISGTAVGSYADRPVKSATATFTITTRC